jgi:putative heme-binding domain-containing protein
MGGHGGAIGPDLGGIGARRNATEIRNSILDPDASVPLSFLQVRAITKDGRGISGVRINEDSFSIQIRDLSSQFHSFWKTELAEIMKEPRKSLMPSYRDTLTSEELDDLVAYLESNQGVP